MLRLTALFALILGISRISAADWPQFQHDAARTGRTVEAVAPPYRARWIWVGPQKTLRNRDSRSGDGAWTDDLTPRRGMRLDLPAEVAHSFAGSMQPIVLDQTVFIADAQSRVYAVNLDDGSTRWQADNPGGSLWPGVAADNIVAFASLLGYVTAYDASTGRRLWQVDTGRTISSAPALVDGIIYVANQGGHVYALRLADGTQLWRSSRLGGPVQGGLCVANGRVYLGTDAMEAMALDARDGRIVARQKLTGQSFRFTWPVAAGSRIIFTTVPVICPGSEYVNDPILGAGRKLTRWPEPPGHPSPQAEEQAMLEWLAGEGRDWEQFFALDAQTLSKDYIIATGATEGCGASPNPPALDAQGRPLLWWATAYPTLTSIGSFGTHFSMDISAVDLATGRRILIDNGRHSGQSTETDNLFALTVGGEWVYLRQNFRGTAAINLRTSQQQWISKTVHEDGQHNPAAVYYGSSGAKGPDGEPIIGFLPRGPRSPHGRTAPAIAGGRLLFTEGFGALTCVESAR